MDEPAAEIVEVEKPPRLGCAALLLSLTTLGALAAGFYFFQRAAAAEDAVRKTKSEAGKAAKYTGLPADAAGHFERQNRRWVFVADVSEEAVQTLNDGFVVKGDVKKSLGFASKPMGFEIHPSQSIMSAAWDRSFDWTAPFDKATYDISVMGKSKTELASGKGLTQPHWQAVEPLAPGETYRVTVVAKAGANMAKISTTFRIATAPEAEQMLARTAAIADPLGRARVLVENGYLEDAYRIVDRLSQDELPRLKELRRELRLLMAFKD